MDKWKVCDQTMNQSEKILEIKDILLASFSVKHLYIFGSYSKNEINEYSDLDVFIKVKRRKKKERSTLTMIFYW